MTFVDLVDFVDIVDIVDIFDSIDIVDSVDIFKTIWITSESLWIPRLSNLKNVNLNRGSKRC